LQFGRDIANPPRIFSVNWFRKDANGKFVWPGFGENMRILKWVVDRANGKVGALESPLGWMPRYEDLMWDGLNFSEAKFYDAMSVDRDQWVKELLLHEELFSKLYDRLPKELIFIRELLLSALWRSPEHWEMPHDSTNA
jgi:phosphoenolpyruvate carboxykinase (GTP)